MNIFVKTNMQIMKLFTNSFAFIILIFSFVSCNFSNAFDCDGEIDELIMGQVFDNYTELPISGAQLNYEYLSSSGKQRILVVESDENGLLNFSGSGCFFEQSSYKFESASHTEYDGALASRDFEYQTILMYKLVDFKLIFENTNPEDTVQVRYHQWSCLYPGPNCKSVFERGVFRSHGIDTIDIKVPEGETFDLKYVINGCEFYDEEVKIGHRGEVHLQF